MNNIKCSKCNTDTSFTDETDFIQIEKEKGTTYMLLFCESCNESFEYNPAESIVTYKPNQPEELVWRCPTSGCHGYVSYISGNETPCKDGKSFYGCGETGKMWYEKEEFYSEIEIIIKKYPYRKKCYEYKNNEWLPRDCDIDELIDLEEDRTYE